MRRGVARLVLILTMGAGCADLVGVHFDDPGRPAATDAGPRCSVADAGATSVRLGDFVPSGDRYDFCFTRTDGTSPLDGVPAVASQGSSAPDGLGYEQVLAPIAIPAGVYDVQVQPAGQGCSGAPIAEASVCAGGPVTLLLVGDGTAQPSLDAFPESAPPTGAASLRFIHAIANAGNLDFGSADQPALPASVTPIFADVAFGAAGAAAASADGASDANGYVVAASQPTPTPLATAPSGARAASMLTDQLLSSAHGYTVFAAGSASDARFPPELFVCDEAQTDGALTSCGGAPFTVTVDSVNAFLFGPLSAHPSLRTQPLIDALANLTSDVVCVNNLLLDGDKASLTDAAATSGRFPYHQWYADNLDTPVDDPTDQHGNVPPPPSTPGCPDTTSQAELSGLLGCLAQQCSTKPGDETGTIIEDPYTCLVTQCTSVLESIIGTSPFCWGCALVELQNGATFQDIQTSCTTDPAGGRMILNGQSGIVLLSRLPITSPWQWVLPATGTRAGLVGATITLPNEAALDVACVQMTSPGDGLTVPYTGQYGNGLGTGQAAWQQELLLQVGKVVAHTRASAVATGRRAILAGQWNTGPTVPGVLAAYNTDSFTLLDSAFAQGVPIGFMPACTYCASNVLVTSPGTQPTVQSTWGTYPVLGRIPVTDVASASVILQDDVIPYDGYEIPLSPCYGFRSTVRIRP